MQASCMPETVLGETVYREVGVLISEVPRNCSWGNSREVGVLISEVPRNCSWRNSREVGVHISEVTLEKDSTVLGHLISHHCVHYRMTPAHSHRSRVIKVLACLRSFQLSM